MVSSCPARQVQFFWNFRAPKRRWSQATTILALGALWSVWQSAGSLRRFSQQLLLKYCQMQNVEILLRKPGFYKKKGWLHREIMMYRYHLYNLLASYVYLDADVENRISLMGWTPWHPHPKYPEMVDCLPLRRYGQVFCGQLITAEIPRGQCDFEPYQLWDHQRAWPTDTNLQVLGHKCHGDIELNGWHGCGRIPW